jgi:3-oxoacyl-[acyl-carrier protein] reductase
VNELLGKVALVTGGANGIGRAAAIALAAEGASVVIFDRVDAATTGAAIGHNARRVVGSVASEGDIVSLFKGIKHLDILVNCAGIQLIRPLLETTLEDLDAVIGVNFKGTFLVGREAARLMMAQETGGRIINIASELAYVGRARYSAYCATKGAIVSLTRAWARELAPRILVNAVAPGPTDTAMVSLESLSREELDAEVASVPLGRIAEPEEIAATIIFLAGPKAGYFTGQCISPNGGAAMF